MKSVGLNVRQLEQIHERSYVGSVGSKEQNLFGSVYVHYRMNSCPAQFYRLKKELVANMDLYPNYVKRIFIKK